MAPRPSRTVSSPRAPGTSGSARVSSGRRHAGPAELVDDPAAGRDPVLRLGAGHGPERRPAHRMDDCLEGLVHVLDLPDLVVRPLPMEAQHGDAPAVHRIGVDVAVAVVVRNLLAASGEADHRAIGATVRVLEVLPVTPAARVPLDPAHEAGGWLIAPAPYLDVVAAGEIELRVVEPPGHVEVHPAHAVLVVRHAVGEAWD